MTTLEAPPTLADAIAAADGIPPERIVMNPRPGTATKADLTSLAERGLSYELVDGTLRRKLMGFEDDRLALWVGWLISNYVFANKLGKMGGSQAQLELMPDLVRMPDACFTTKEDAARETGKAFQLMPPALVVEVLSPSNTKSEMTRKLAQYAAAGVRLAWIVDGRKETVAVYPDADKSKMTVLTVNDTLDGGDVLPGFSLPLQTLFDVQPV